MCYKIQLRASSNLSGQISDTFLLFFQTQWLLDSLYSRTFLALYCLQNSQHPCLACRAHIIFSHLIPKTLSSTLTGQTASPSTPSWLKSGYGI